MEMMGFAGSTHPTYYCGAPKSAFFGIEFLTFKNYPSFRFANRTRWGPATMNPSQVNYVGAWFSQPDAVRNRITIGFALT
jgi:hypothetical protein